MKNNADTKGELEKNSIWAKYFRMGRLSNGMRVETKGVPCKQIGKSSKHE